MDSNIYYGFLCQKCLKKSSFYYIIKIGNFNKDFKCDFCQSEEDSICIIYNFKLKDEIEIGEDLNYAK